MINDKSLYCRLGFNLFNSVVSDVILFWNIMVGSVWTEWNEQITSNSCLKLCPPGNQVFEHMLSTNDLAVLISFCTFTIIPTHETFKREKKNMSILRLLFTFCYAIFSIPNGVLFLFSQW